MDDPVQSPKASALIQELTTEQPGYISLVALAEVVWSLVSIYAFTREQIAETVLAFLESAELRLEADEEVAQAHRLFLHAKASFSDCLIASAGMHARCDYTATFDQKAARDLGMRLL